MRIELVEFGDPVDVPLPVETGAALATSGVINAVPSYTPGSWTLRATSKIGVAQIADVEIWIRPKVPIARLVFLLGYALDPSGWRDEHVHLGEAPDLLPALAYAYERQADRALQRGLLQGYRTVEESLPVLRGRVREADQLRRRYGLLVPLEVRYDEFTADIAENLLLLAATERLLRLPRVPGYVRHRLLRLRLRLADVTLPVRGRPLPRWQPTRLNARYHVALRLAELILRGSSIEQQEGKAPVSGFLFDMFRVFEDFVTTALSEALTSYGGRAQRQDTTHRLDLAGLVSLRPDLVWYDEPNPVAVVDAKYKSEKPSGFPEADLYQMLAYCTGLGLPRGYLVYAKGNEDAATYVVRNAGTQIICHAVDLEKPPEGLLAEIASIAAELVGTHAATA